MSETRDIVERLKACACTCFEEDGSNSVLPDGVIRHEAADLITRLRTENATLKAEWRQAMHHLAFIRTCTVIAWPRTPSGAYPIEHNPRAGKESWSDILNLSNQLCPEWAKENP